MPKVAFFDMDGTITAPRFIDNGEYVCGFNLRAWVAHCERLKEKSYDACSVLQPVVDFAKQLASDNIPCIILTVACSKGEHIAKRAFLKDHGLENLFPRIIFCTDSKEKPDIILSYAAHNHLTPSDCMLVEDDYMCVLRAHDMGIQAAHISNIIAGNITK